MNFSDLIKKTIVVLLFQLPFVPGLAISGTAKEACTLLRVISDQLQEQLPIAVDYTTRLVGHSVVYAAGYCTMQYVYLVKTDPFVEEMMTENNLSREENLEWLTGVEGQSFLKEHLQVLANDARRTHMGNIQKYSNVKVFYQHSFDDRRLPSIVSVVLDTTGR